MTVSAPTTRAAEWSLWSTTARLVVTDPARLDDAVRIADRILADIDAACSRFRADSELSRIAPALADGVDVSPLLATLVRYALDVAAETDGTVDPTLGYALSAVGYDRDIRLVEDSDRILRAIVSRRPGWKSVSLNGSLLRLPAHLALDLGATAKAVAADLVAAEIVDQLGCGVLVSLGGDIATAGTPPRVGWHVLVQDLPDDRRITVELGGGTALATSSTQKRRWTRAGIPVHHILDPRTGLPAPAVWKTVTAAAPSCLAANALSTSSIVRGEEAVSWLAAKGVAARLVRWDDTVITTGDWPAEPASATPATHPELRKAG